MWYSPYTRWFALLGGLTGAVLLTKLIRRHFLDSLSSALSTSMASIAPHQATATGKEPFASEKIKEYYSFIVEALSKPQKEGDTISVELLNRKKVALDILKFLSGFATEQDRIREKGLIPILLNDMETSLLPDIQLSSAFVISNISLQQRNHAILNQLHALPRLFAIAQKLRSLRIDALQLLLNLSFHPQNITDENLREWNGVQRIVWWLNDFDEKESILALKVLINLSYIPFYAQQIELDETLWKQIKVWSNSTNDDIRPRAKMLKENLK